jgi:hypothetical protein
MRDIIHETKEKEALPTKHLRTMFPSPNQHIADYSQQVCLLQLSKGRNTAKSARIQALQNVTGAF